MDCFMAPCIETCPIHQDITAYMDLVAEGKICGSPSDYHRKESPAFYYRDGLLPYVYEQLYAQLL